MAQSRSFAEYVKDKCYGDLFEAAERYVENVLFVSSKPESRTRE